MNVVDSSGWLEYFADGPNASFFAEPLRETSTLVVPTVSIYEVFKAVFRQKGESDALQAAALMEQAFVADLTPGISVLAAHISVEQRLPMADSIILATARTHKAVLWTQDSDFEKIDGARYMAKKTG